MSVVDADQAEPVERRPARSALGSMAGALLVATLCVILGRNYVLGVLIQGAPTANEWVLRFFQYIFFLIPAAAIFLDRRQDWIRSLGVCLPFLIGWSFLTLFAAVKPVGALRQLLPTVALIFALAVIVDGLESWEKMRRLMVRLFLITILIDWAVVFVDPSLGIHAATAAEPGVAGAWRGIHIHKNVAGVFCSLGVILGLFSLLEKRSLEAAALAGLCGVFMLATSSKMAVAALSLAILFGLYAVAPRSRAWALGLCTILVSALLTLTYIVFSGAYREILRALFNDETLTGRTRIWAFVLEYIRDKPIFGSGAFSFWARDPGSGLLIGPAARASDPLIGVVPHAHNTYLDMAAALGLPGLALALGAFVIAPVMLISTTTRFNRSAMGALSAIWAFSILSGLTTVVFMQELRLEWAALLIAIFGLRAIKRDAWRPARP